MPTRSAQSTSRSRPPLLHRLFRRGERTLGQSIVEFTLILPVFLLLLGTTLDLGRIAAARVTVENAAREGAFEASGKNATFDATHAWAGSQSSWNPASPGTCNRTTDSVTCRALLEARSGSVVAISPWDVARACTPSPCAKGLGNTSTVTVSGRMALLTPILRPFFGGQTTLTFSAASTTQIETLPTPSGMPAPTPTPTPAPTTTPTPTATPTPTPTPPTCSLPSAGFNSSISPSNAKAPVILTVKDTSTYSGGSSCAITSWVWSWGDLSGSTTTTTAGITITHTYGVAGTYKVTLTVTNPAGSKTSGAVTITVK